MFALMGAAAGCAPSQSEVLRPVQTEAASRTGFEIERRAAPPHDDEVRAVIRELLEDELSEEDAIRVALLGNQRAQAAIEELGIARGDLIDAARIENPELEASLRFPVGEGDREVEIDAVQDVVSLFEIGRRRGAASARLEAAQQDAVGEIVDVVAEVRRAYYRAIAAERALEMRNTVRDAAEAALAFAEGVHDAGNITDLDLLRERDVAEEARLAVEEARERRLVRREDLSAALGLWGEETAWVLPAELDAIPEDEPERPPLEGLAVERSLDLSAGEHRLRAAGSDVGLARFRRWVPRLGVGVSAEREWADSGWSLGPLVQLSVPLWDWNAGAVRRAEAHLAAEQRRYSQTAVEVRAGARAAEHRLRAARARASRYRDDVLPLRAELLEETQRAHHAMAASTFDLLRARRRQIEAEAGYVRAKLEYWLARASVEQISAGRRPDPRSDRRGEREDRPSPAPELPEEGTTP